MPESVTASQTLSAALIAIVAELERFETGIRRDDDDALHQARTRVRRMRGILSVYRRVFAKDARRGLRHRLAAYGERLGTARDAEVRAAALRESMDAAEHPHLRDALDDLVAVAEADAVRTRSDVLAVLDAPEHRELLKHLRTFAARPPAGREADLPVAAAAHRALIRATRRVMTAADRAGLVEAAAGVGDLDALHTLRKAARRLRYAAEAVAPELTQPADSHETESHQPESQELALATAAEALQDALGDHRDAVLLAGELRARVERSGHPDRSRVVALADRIAADASQRLAGLDRMLDELAAASAAYNSTGPRS